MLLLRLFKARDIVFVAQVVRTQDNIFRQYKYPMAFSNYHSRSLYEMSEPEIPKFNEFFTEATKWPGWNAPWFNNVARRYFLWGGSKEFYPGRDNERILDYMIALEAAFVPEGDFVSRRLRERTAAILGGTEGERSIFIERIKNFYNIRSTFAHGNLLSNEQIKFLEENSFLFENDVRKLLREILKNCPSNDDARREYLCQLYDVSDKQRAEKIFSDFKAIKNVAIRNKLLDKLRESVSMNSKPTTTEKILGTICNYCPLCRYARNNPETWFGRLMEWHGKYCPFWRAQKALYQAGSEKEDAERF